MKNIDKIIGNYNGQKTCACQYTRPKCILKLIFYFDWIYTKKMLHLFLNIVYCSEDYVKESRVAHSAFHTPRPVLYVYYTFCGSSKEMGSGLR